MSSDRFRTTRWTEVVAAQGSGDVARQSLRILCEQYYTPVHAFISRYSQGSDQARDWTHSFFAQLLEEGSLDSATPNRGRFRSYLCGAVKHFISNERDRERAEKRGGKATIYSLESEQTLGSTGLKYEQPSDAYFDRDWAHHILAQALTELEREVSQTPSDNSFVHLKPWLVGEPDDRTQSELVDAIGLSVHAIRSLLYRWRKRFRNLVIAQISETVSDPSEVANELRYLVECLKALPTKS